MRVLMVGCGNMGGALLARWVDVPGISFCTADPVSAFPDTRVQSFDSASKVTGGPFDLLVIAVKPQMIADIIPGYLPHLQADAAVLSIAAGVSCARLETVVGQRPIVRVMPNLPAKIGKGVSGLHFNETVPEAVKDLIRQMMLAAGSIVEVDQEDSLDKVTAIAGSGPGYVFEIARAYVDAAMALGFDADQARTLVLDTIAGAVEMAAGTQDDLADMRNAVTSKAGTTEAGLSALNGNGDLSQLMLAATQAAYKRAVELR